MASITLGKAINEGLRSAMTKDAKVLVMGEDVGKLGGVFRITDGLQKEFGDDRVIDTPLAESGIMGTAVGLAMRGYRPVVEIQFDGFTYPAFDQIVSQVAKLHNRSAGHITLPITIRIPYGGGIGAVEHHSESPESYFAHTAGLKVVSPSNPLDGYVMIQQAIAHDDPVIFFEPKRRYYEKADIELASAMDSAYPLFSSRVARAGDAATIVAYGPMVKTAIEASAAYEKDTGRALEVIDLRSISPLDISAVVTSVKKTGRCIVVHEASGEASVSSEVAAKVQELAFYSLEAPVLRVTGFDVPYPASRIEEEFLPDLDRVLDAVDRSFAY